MEKVKKSEKLSFLKLNVFGCLVLKKKTLFFLKNGKDELFMKIKLLFLLIFCFLLVYARAMAHGRILQTAWEHTLC